MERAHSLAEKIYNIKEKLTDGEYLDLMNLAKGCDNNFYLVTYLQPIIDSREQWLSYKESTCIVDANKLTAFEAETVRRGRGKIRNLHSYDSIAAIRIASDISYVSAVKNEEDEYDGDIREDKIYVQEVAIIDSKKL